MMTDGNGDEWKVSEAGEGRRRQREIGRRDANLPPENESPEVVAAGGAGWEAVVVRHRKNISGLMLRLFYFERFIFFF